MTIRDDLEARERALSAELKRRKDENATARQVRMARGRRSAGDVAEYETDPERMTTTERQMLAAHGIRPRKRDDAD